MDFYLLVLLICTTPALLMIDSPIDGGAISAILAIALAFSARTIRPGQADHFFVLARPVVFVVAIPAVWILVQILPLGFSGLSNPIWDSASVGIGHPMLGLISIDPGLTLLSLSRYFTILAVLFLSMVVSIDRPRAQWVLFALTAATALTALVLIGDDLAGTKFLFATENTASGIGALDSATLGLILSSASAIRVFDRFETQRTKGKSVDCPLRDSIPVLCRCVCGVCGCNFTPRDRVSDSCGRFGPCDTCIRRVDTPTRIGTMGAFGDRVSRDRHCGIGCGNAARFSDSGTGSSPAPANHGAALLPYRANSGCKSLDRNWRRDIRGPNTHLSGCR